LGELATAEPFTEPEPLTVAKSEPFAISIAEPKAFAITFAEPKPRGITRSASIIGRQL